MVNFKDKINVHYKKHTVCYNFVILHNIIDIIFLLKSKNITIYVKQHDVIDCVVTCPADSRKSGIFP